jgi:hypothetical protein
MTETPPLKATMVPITSLKGGERTTGGIVTGIRYSKSRKTVTLTLRGNRGEREWPRESASANTAVYEHGNPAPCALPHTAKAWEA